MVGPGGEGDASLGTQDTARFAQEGDFVLNADTHQLTKERE